MCGSVRSIAACRVEQGREGGRWGRTPPAYTIPEPREACEEVRVERATERHSGDNQQVLGWGKEAMSTGEGQVSLHWGRGVTGSSPCWEAGHGQQGRGLGTIRTPVGVRGLYGPGSPDDRISRTWGDTCI